MNGRRLLVHAALTFAGMVASVLLFGVAFALAALAFKVRP